MLQIYLIIRPTLGAYLYTPHTVFFTILTCDGLLNNCNMCSEYTTKYQSY